VHCCVGPTSASADIRPRGVQIFDPRRDDTGATNRETENLAFSSELTGFIRLTGAVLEPDPGFLFSLQCGLRRSCGAGVNALPRSREPPLLALEPLMTAATPGQVASVGAVHTSVVLVVAEWSGSGLCGDREDRGDDKTRDKSTEFHRQVLFSSHKSVMTKRGSPKASERHSRHKLARDRPLHKQRRLERQAITTKASHNLNAERKSGFVC
jgi:hypothetical protein